MRKLAQAFEKLYALSFPQFVLEKTQLFPSSAGREGDPKVQSIYDALIEACKFERHEVPNAAVLLTEVWEAPERTVHLSQENLHSHGKALELAEQGILRYKSHTVKFSPSTLAIMGQGPSAEAPGAEGLRELWAKIFLDCRATIERIRALPLLNENQLTLSKMMYHSDFLKPLLEGVALGGLPTAAGGLRRADLSPFTGDAFMLKVVRHPSLTSMKCHSATMSLRNFLIAQFPNEQGQSSRMSMVEQLRPAGVLEECRLEYGTVSAIAFTEAASALLFEAARKTGMAYAESLRDSLTHPWKIGSEMEGEKLEMMVNREFPDKIIYYNPEKFRELITDRLSTIASQVAADFRSIDLKRRTI